MSSPNALQNKFLDELIQSQKPIAIYLVSGIKLVGHLIAYDAYVLLLKHDVHQMVHKHAIATIMPVAAPAKNAADKSKDTRVA